MLGVPVILGTRPGRHRARLSSDHHRQQIYVDSNGLLVPATTGLDHEVQRSASSSGHGRRSPTQIFITNTQREEHSPVRPSRHRSVRYEIDEDDWDERAHSPHRHERRRARRRESRSPSPRPLNPEMEAKLKKLDQLEEKEREAERKRRFEEEQALKKFAEEKKKEQEEKMKKDAIEADRIKQLEKAVKEKKAKEEADKEFRERVKTTFGNAGYSDESIERILQKEGKGGHEGQKRIMDLSRPTYIKVHRKHLSPDTLDAYSLPWEFDDVRSHLSCFVYSLALS